VRRDSSGNRSPSQICPACGITNSSTTASRKRCHLTISGAHLHLLRPRWDLESRRSGLGGRFAMDAHLLNSPSQSGRSACCSNDANNRS
jgi:hypothetical protein